MKRSWMIVLFSFSLISCKGIGQTKRDSSIFNIGISVGSAVPFASFGSPYYPTSNNVSYQPGAPGYAEIGFHFDITSQLQLSKEFGAMVFIGGNINAFDVNAYNGIWGGSPSGIISAGNYYVGEYLAGFTFQITIKKNLFLNMNALCGIITLNQPIAIDIGENNINGPFSTEFAGRITIGLTKIISSRWKMMYEISYLDSKITYQQYQNNVTWQLCILTPTFGVGYRF